MKTLLKLVPIAALLLFLNPLISTTASSQTSAPLRVGMIGLDTSHVTAFTQMLNDPKHPGHVPGARVVAAFKGGSPDFTPSASRVEKFTAELKDKWGVEIVSSIEELCQKVDAVLLTSVDGRTHLQQVRPVFAARKRVFIDKPFAASLRDAKEIVRLSRASGVPFFSSSSLRFIADFQELKTDKRLGTLTGAITWSPATIESFHPDLFWYGIHGIETLFTLMGPGCETVTRVYTNGADVVTGRWKDGRIGTFRGLRDGKHGYGAIAFGSESTISVQPQKTDYRNLVVEIVQFFQTGIAPVAPEETLEIIAFMEAADLSKKRNSAAVSVSELLK